MDNYLADLHLQQSDAMDCRVMRNESNSDSNDTG